SAAALLAGLLGLAGFGIAHRFRSQPANVVEADPRLIFPTPYRNTRPDVAYVNDSVCAQCHPDHAEWFHNHPMRQSLGPVATVAALQRYDASVRNPFEATGAIFEVERQGTRIFHKEIHRDSGGNVIAQAREEVQYVIGSGVHNYSYLIERDGFLTQ